MFIDLLLFSSQSWQVYFKIHYDVVNCMLFFKEFLIKRYIFINEKF